MTAVFVYGEGFLFRRVTVRTTGGKEPVSYEWLGSTQGLPDLDGSWPRTIDRSF